MVNGQAVWDSQHKTGSRDFIDSMTTRVFDKKKLQKSITRTKLVNKKWHDDDVFTVMIGEDIYLMYRAVRLQVYDPKTETEKSFRLTGTKFMYITDKMDYELITDVDEDKPYEKPHEFIKKVLVIFQEIVNNKTYMLHYQSNNKSLARFSKWCIRKQRELNE
jgi:hypothetical protein